MKSIIFSFSFAAAVFGANAAVRLGSPFTDGAVLQRERPVPVWGKADPGEKVTVSFGGQTLHATADSNGAWRVTLAPMKADATPRTLRVEPGAIAVKDVLVGEVWLASGQSNMAFRFAGLSPRSREKHGALLAQITTRPLIRYANIDKKASATECDHTKVEWKTFAPHNTRSGGPLAVAGYFALYLHDALNVPVGIIGCAWGATNIDAWIPHTEESAKSAKAPRRPMCHPGFVYRGTVAPLKPFSMRGVIWYQGEADSDEPGKYEARMKMLYDSWGRLFENEKWPFIFAQLAPFNYSKSTPKRDFVGLQLAQASFAENEPNAYMATINDLGNLWDIHPNEKGPVGMRFAALALQHVYGFKNVAADPPAAVSAKALDGGKVEISFRNGNGLYVYNENRSLEIGLEIAGEDGVFHDAEIAEVEKSGALKSGPGRLVACSKQVPKPKAVRYLFKTPWYGALRNRSGIPSGPFILKVQAP